MVTSPRSASATVEAATPASEPSPSRPTAKTKPAKAAAEIVAELRASLAGK